LKILLYQHFQLYNQNHKNSILLGGDTVSEVQSKAIKSSVDGAALQYICNGNLPVLDALIDSKLTFNL
jgi:3-phosphoglycerate kinase